MTATQEESRFGPWASLWLLFGLFFGSLLVAAVASPLIYAAVKSWAATSSSSLAEYLAGKDFPRYFDRLRWLVVIAGLPWVCRRTGLASRDALGLRWTRSSQRMLRRWFGFGVVMIAVITSGQLATGVSVSHGYALSRVVEIAALGLLSAVLIGLLEELVFRAVVFRLVLRPLGAALAVPAAAAVYALMHFQRVPSDLWADDTPVSLGSGFIVAAGNLRGMVVNLELLPFVALFAAGCAFCLLLLRSETLLATIGLHAGWVWGALCHRRLLYTSDTSMLWGGRLIIDGLLPLAALVCLALTLALLHRFGSRDASEAPPTPR